MKRYIFEVVADSQSIAESKLEELGYSNHYLLTTEPEKTIQGKIRVLLSRMDTLDENEYLCQKYAVLDETLREIKDLIELASELK